MRAPRVQAEAAARKGTPVIDVRPGNEFKRGRIPGSVSCQFYQPIAGGWPLFLTPALCGWPGWGAVRPLASCSRLHQPVAGAEQLL